MGGRTFSNLEPVGCKFVKLPLNFIITQTGKKNTADTGHPVSTECFPQDRFLWFQQSSPSSFSLTLALTGELSCLSRTHSSGSPSSEGGSFFSWTHQTPQSSSRILRLHRAFCPEPPWMWSAGIDSSPAPRLGHMCQTHGILTVTSLCK